MPEPGEVKAARNRAGLTQQQLADILGVHVKTLRDYEKGKRARLRAGQAKLSDFIAAHPEPQKAPPPGTPVAAPRPLAEASDMELIAVLTARLALLRAAVDGPIPATVGAMSPAAPGPAPASAPAPAPPATGAEAVDVECAAAQVLPPSAAADPGPPQESAAQSDAELGRS